MGILISRCGQCNSQKYQENYILLSKILLRLRETLTPAARSELDDELTCLIIKFKERAISDFCMDVSIDKDIVELEREFEDTTTTPSLFLFKDDSE